MIAIGDTTTRMCAACRLRRCFLLQQFTRFYAVLSQRAVFGPVQCVDIQKDLESARNQRDREEFFSVSVSVSDPPISNLSGIIKYFRALSSRIVFAAPRPSFFDDYHAGDTRGSRELRVSHCTKYSALCIMVS